MQTQTVVIGVRGTEWYTLLLPNCSNIYNIHGLLELSSSNRRIQGSLLLHTLKYREVCRDRLPGPEKDVTPGILAMLRRMMYSGAGAAPPDALGGEGLPSGVDNGSSCPEEVMPPYAPTT